MKQILRATIRPIFIGFLFYLFVLLANNSGFIAEDLIRTWTTLIAGVLFLYLIAFAAIKDRKSFGIATIGFSIAHLLFSIGMPVFMIINEVFFVDHSKKPPRSLLEKDNIQIIVDFKKCHKIRYGTFILAYDTIIRYSENNKDYEIVKTFDSQTTNRIKWLDSCSYVRFNEDNGLTSEYLRLGNFKGGTHDIYSKPTNLHKLSDEKIEMASELKN
ncbi:hypothetical protein Q4Q39_06990 [Flavivirga amylovorans]|uniref:Uncharacterized protein n=1 Tax=Flavivirga amylovorans TaxID=870486 RepID=A0ABT8WZN4_9FLAO|nr:hypothetical protein [Flavivirga amylovorans]MDO5987137.1 hypothetical protein [Flavivirga amylovorans]